MIKSWTSTIKDLFGTSKFAAAVSGGPDSMAMLEMKRKKIKVVCHVNYNKRESSKKDEQLVRDYCSKNNIICEVLNVNDEVYQKYSHIKNFQSQARIIRYDFFKKVVEHYKLDGIYIAHNFNDHLETAYMQYARDSKSLFYGIKEKNTINGLYIERPVLTYLKKTLQRHCDESKIPYSIDETNELEIYERNKVRKEINSWSQEQLYDFKTKINKYNKENKYTHDFVEISYIDFKKSKYSLDFFVKLDNLVQYYLIFYLLNDNNIKNVSENKIKSVIVFLENKNNKNKLYRVQEEKFVRVDEENKIIIVSNKENEVYDEILGD